MYYNQDQKKFLQFWIQQPTYDAMNLQQLVSNQILEIEKIKQYNMINQEQVKQQAHLIQQLQQQNQLLMTTISQQQNNQQYLGHKIEELEKKQNEQPMKNAEYPAIVNSKVRSLSKNKAFQSPGGNSIILTKSPAKYKSPLQNLGGPNTQQFSQIQACQVPTKNLQEKGRKEDLKLGDKSCQKCNNEKQLARDYQLEDLQKQLELIKLQNRQLQKKNESLQQQIKFLEEQNSGLIEQSKKEQLYFYQEKQNLQLVHQRLLQEKSQLVDLVNLYEKQKGEGQCSACHEKQIKLDYLEQQNIQHQQQIEQVQASEAEKSSKLKAIEKQLLKYQEQYLKSPSENEQYMSDEHEHSRSIRSSNSEISLMRRKQSKKQQEGSNDINSILLQMVERYIEKSGDEKKKINLPLQAVQEEKKDKDSFIELYGEEDEDMLGPADINKIMNHPLNSIIRDSCENTWNLDFYDLNHKNKGRSLVQYGFCALKQFEIDKAFSCVDDKMIIKFFAKIQQGYRHNPYHNYNHGADVTNSICFFLGNGLKDILNPIEQAAIIISAAAHDLGHPGLNNAFLISIKSKQAIQYNDSSILENYHASQFFHILNEKDVDITQNMNEKDYRYFRKICIQVILDTDLSKHFGILNKFKEKISPKVDQDGNNVIEFDSRDDADKLILMSIAIKCADIGHGAKSQELHKQWSRRIIEEFYIQGSKEIEYGIALSPLNDRNQFLAKSQEGFLQHIVLPIYTVFNNFMNNLNINMQCYEQILKNLEYWIDQQSHEKTPGKLPFMADTQAITSEFVMNENIDKNFNRGKK